MSDPDLPRLAALGSLPTRNALDALHDDRAGKRPQRIYTPTEVASGLRRLWPEGVALDPCHGPDSVVGAERVCFPEHDDPERRDGLAVDWPERTYTNPPYDSLEPWLGRWSNALEVVALVPVRTHRRWFRAAMRKADAIAWLDPLRFLGYAQTFPAPLCLLYRGGAHDRFADAFEHLGDVQTGSQWREPKQCDLFG